MFPELYMCMFILIYMYWIYIICVYTVYTVYAHTHIRYIYLYLNIYTNLAVIFFPCTDPDQAYSQVRMRRMVGKESPRTWNQDILGISQKSAAPLDRTEPGRGEGDEGQRRDGWKVRESRSKSGRRERERGTAGIWIGKRGEDRPMKMKMKTGSAFWSSHIFKCMRRKR